MQRAFFITGTVMAALFIGCGFVFLCTGFLIERLPKPDRIWFGIIFIAYGGFRAVRQYNQYKKMKQEENE
ncbi:MAG TPA: hypothetical protein VKG26_08630 [Bacteroidia bacterium]|nr:hypothetical protein [Bacteroidia bacterium]